MTETIVGKVLRFGKVKDYGRSVNFGKDWEERPRFFLEVESEEHDTVLAMVDCKAENNGYGLRIPTDADRQRPLVGDIVEFTTHKLRDGKWASVTWNQKYDIIKESEQARAERDEWIAQQKQKREEDFQAKIEDQKHQKEEAEKHLLEEIEFERNDEQLPPEVREHISKTFRFDTIRSLLRYTFWFGPIREGEGGRRAEYDLVTGQQLSDGYPGTGMRRSGGPLYGHPAKIRQSIIEKAVVSGLIYQTNPLERERSERLYAATQKGERLLAKLDTCEETGDLREPYKVIGHYSTQHTSFHYDCGYTFMTAKEEHEKTYNSFGVRSNTGTSYDEIKKPKKLAILKEAK